MCYSLCYELLRCAHIEGGEISGTIDEILRHCNTKLASFHFVSSEQAAERVARLGEQKIKSTLLDPRNWIST